MKHLAGLQLVAIARAVQQVAVALAKGVVDFHDDGAQLLVGVVAVPEAHRLEGVAEHAWVAVQPHLADRVVDALLGQQFIKPGQRTTTLRPAAVAMIAAGLAGGLIGLLPAILKIKWRANELVSSLMFNYIFYFIGSFIILYYLRDRNQTILASMPFQKTFNLPKLVQNTQLHAGFIIAAVFVVIVSIFLFRTRWGYEIRIVGANPKFAAYAGIPVATVALYAHFVSGFIGGLGGAVEMSGLYRAFIWQINPSYAMDGVIVAMLARKNPKFVPLSAFFLAYLRVGADFMSRRGDVAFEFITLLQGLIILILASDKIINYFKARRLRRNALIAEDLTMKNGPVAAQGGKA